MFHPSKYRSTIAQQRPPRRTVRHLRIGWVASFHPGCERLAGEDTLDRGVMDPAIIATPANGRDLMGVKGRILRLQGQDALPNVRRHLPPVRGGACRGGKETGQPGRIEEVCLARRRALGDADEYALPAAVSPNRLIGRRISYTSCSGQLT